MKPWLKYVTAGWLLNVGTTSLWQDALGKEQFLKMASDCWMPAFPFSVPLGIFMVIVGAELIHQAKKESE